MTLFLLMWLGLVLGGLVASLWEREGWRLKQFQVTRAPASRPESDPRRQHGEPFSAWDGHHAPLPTPWVVTRAGPPPTPPVT
jgi:hypothetical protein